MKKTFLFLIVFQFLIFISFAQAGWPEDGWYAAPDLEVSHRGTPLKLTGIHHGLAIQERDLSLMLPHGNTTNIVLANISFFVGGELKTYPILGPNHHPYVFESGWESSFQGDPTLALVESSINTNAPARRKEEPLSQDAKLALVADFEKILTLRRVFQTRIRGGYDFFADKATISDIFQHIESTFQGINEESPEFPVFAEFMRNRSAYMKAQSILSEVRTKAREDLVRLSSEPSPDELNDDALQDVEVTAKRSRQDLFAANKNVAGIGAKVIATYWHSEQRLLHHIAERGEEILRSIGDQIKAPPEAIILSLHSRFDICEVCSHSIVRSFFPPPPFSSSASSAAAAHSSSSSSARTLGIQAPLIRPVCEKFELDPSTLPFFVTSSFREEREQRKKIDFSKEKQVSLRDLNDLAQRFPAFPMCHIPSERLPPLS